MHLVELPRPPTLPLIPLLLMDDNDWDRSSGAPGSVIKFGHLHRASRWYPVLGARSATASAAERHVRGPHDAKDCAMHWALITSAPDTIGPCPCRYQLIRLTTPP